MPVNEPRLLALAQMHHLEPVLAHYLPAATLTAATTAQLQAAARRQRIRATVMTHAFLTLQAQLDRAGVPVIPLKGIVQAHTLYPGPALRYFDDIDLLVPGEAAPIAESVLQEAGYAPHPRALRPDWHHLIPYTHPQHGATVEIHTGLVRRHPAGWPVADIWARARRGELAGQSAWLLANEDALIFTALHARHHLFDKLNFVVETVWLAQRVTNTAELLRRVDAAGARAALAHLLWLADQWGLATDLPVVKAAWLPGQTARRVAGWTDLTPPPDDLRYGALPKGLEILLQDNSGEMWRTGRELVWPSAEFVNTGYAATTSRPLNALNRLWRRTRLAARQLWALRRRASDKRKR